MKNINQILAFGCAALTASTSIGYCATSAELYVGQLSSSLGITSPAANSVWALIYDHNNDGALPGGLTDGTSLTTAQAAAIASEFDGLELTLGESTTSGDTIIALGLTGDDGFATGVIEFDIGETGSILTLGRKYGIYWFPGKTEGNVLSVSSGLEIGGFYESQPHVASGGVYGMAIPASGESGSFIAYDTAAEEGFEASRLVAIVIPEPSTLALAGMGLAVLLRRRRG